MKRSNIAIISNDWHLQETNLEEIQGLVSQMFNLARERGITSLFVLGDIFDNRKAQKESVLNAFRNILDSCLKEGLILIAFPGNHDKTDNSSISSFLDPFMTHPAIRLIRDAEQVELEGLRINCIPFFLNDQWLEKERLIGRADILLSHLALNGSVNNDGTKVDSNITPSLLNSYKKVFLGHYHNYQELTPSIIHLPSLKQNNFGENDFKGCTILYSDISFEIIPLNFKKFITKEINLSKVEDQIKLKEIIDSYDKSYFLKLKITGNKNNKTFDFNELKSLGVLFDLDFRDNTQTDSKMVDIRDKSNVLLLFQSFCEENSLNYENGINYLNQVIDERI